MTPPSELIPVRLTRQELLLLPVETRRRILQEQQDALLEAETALNDKRHPPSGKGEAPPVPGEVRTAPLCADCHTEIRPTQKYALEQVLANSRKRYGKFLCYGCAKRAKEELEMTP